MRIGVVNDSRVVQESIIRLVRGAGHEVVWTALNGIDAVRLCRQQTPELVLMDLVMPQMDGVMATEEIMARCPTAVIIVSSYVTQNVALGFKAISSGAIDIVMAPAWGNAGEEREFLKKIEKVSQVISGAAVVGESEDLVLSDRSPCPIRKRRLIVIGSSAGGPLALESIVRDLPESPNAAIVVVQHIEGAFVTDLVEWLRELCPCPLGLAKDGDALEHGRVLVADSGGHLELMKDGLLRQTDNALVHSCCPSVDRLFNSVARYWREEAAGFILTGMGCDGASGLMALKERGFLTVAQDQATSSIYGMPRVAAMSGAAKEVWSLSKIAAFIRSWTEK